MTVRERLLWSTVDLLRERGVAAAGVASVLERSGVARRSLYLHFPGGKEHLVESATRIAGEYIQSMLERQNDAFGIVSALEHYWESELTRTDFSAGCPVLATTLGASSAPSARDASSDVFSSWLRTVETQIAGDGTDLDKARMLATTIISGFEGAVVLSQATHDLAHLHRTADALRELLTLTTSTTDIPSRES